MATPHDHSPLRRGFTLTELLAVIAIIGVLAAILIPVVAGVRNRARLAEGLSNLRTIGLGISLYGNDNRQQLPGPLNTGQGPRYNLWTTGSLAQKTWNYIGAPEPLAAGTQVADIFTSTAFIAERGSIESPSFLSNQKVALPSGGFINPWASFLRINLAEFDRSQTWALVDLDQKNAPAGAGWASALPPSPIYGNKRVTLYFDWHVDSVAANQ